MASYKAQGGANVVKLGQYWKNTQNGRIGLITKKAGGGKDWLMAIGKKSHHVNEGTLLKIFKKL